VLVAVGIDQHGRREVLSWRPGDSESEETWGQLFRDLKAPGPNSVEMLIFDAHEGIQVAARRCFQAASWQRCRIHCMRKALAKLGGSEDEAEVGRELKELFTLSERSIAGARRRRWRSVGSPNARRSPNNSGLASRTA
jgi:transposase-like protein